MLIASSAEMKYMIALTDGSSNVIIEELGDDIATKSTDLGYEEVPEEIVERTAIEQADIAKKLIPELVIYTIGYDIDDEDTVNVEKILTNVASVDKNGNRLYYKAGVNSSEVVQNLQSVMSTVTENITNNIESTDSTSEVEDNTIVNLVDTIPQECELLENSLEQDSQNIVANVSSDKKSIIWQYPNEQTSDKVYNMSFVMTLSKDALANMSIPEDAKEIEILTNGNTIDSSADSLGSAYVTYGGDKKILLKSPTLTLAVEDIPSTESNLNVTIYNGAKATKSNINYYLFYMYLINNQIKTVDEIEFSIDSANANETVDVSFYKDTVIGMKVTEPINSGYIELYDPTNVKVESKDSSTFTLQSNTKYKMIVSKEYLASNSEEGKLGCNITAKNLNSESVEYFCLITREPFALH